MYHGKHCCCLFTHFQTVTQPPRTLCRVPKYASRVLPALLTCLEKRCSRANPGPSSLRFRRSASRLRPKNHAGRRVSGGLHKATVCCVVFVATGDTRTSHGASMYVTGYIYVLIVIFRRRVHRKPQQVFIRGFFFDVAPSCNARPMSETPGKHEVEESRGDSSCSSEGQRG